MKSGFTIVELIIVISIIAIITLIATPNYSNYKNYALEEEAINIGRQIYLSAIDYEGINDNKSKTMKNFIEEDLGITIYEKDTKDNSENEMFSLLYYSQGKMYKCSFDISRNKYRICRVRDKHKGEKVLYENY